MCIKAKRKPDLGEAEEFCKGYKKNEYDYLDGVYEITEYEMLTDFSEFEIKPTVFE